MRPFYESPSNRDDEDKIASAVAQLRGWTQVKFPRGATVDRVLLNGDSVMALLEVKTRTTPHDLYPTYAVSEERMNLYRLIAARMNVPALLAVQWTDALGVIDVRRTPVEKLAPGGRVDRNDPRDTEPMIHYRIADFYWVKPKQRAA